MVFSSSAAKFHARSKGGVIYSVCVGLGDRVSGVPHKFHYLILSRYLNSKYALMTLCVH